MDTWSLGLGAAVLLASTAGLWLARRDSRRLREILEPLARERNARVVGGRLSYPNLLGTTGGFPLRAGAWLGTASAGSHDESFAEVLLESDLGERFTYDLRRKRFGRGGDPEDSARRWLASRVLERARPLGEKPGARILLDTVSDSSGPKGRVSRFRVFFHGVSYDAADYARLLAVIEALAARVHERRAA